LVIVHVRFLSCVDWIVYLIRPFRSVPVAPTHWTDNVVPLK
jgi:hypothetical protein